MTKKAGFTMIEILLALGVFVIGVFAIISVFPGAKETVVSSEDKSLTAQFVGSLETSILQGGHEFAGSDAPGTTIAREDVVHFTFDVNKEGVNQDFFVLPIDPGDKSVGEVVWYPTNLAGDTWPLTASDVDKGTAAVIGSNEFDGLNGFKGKVRRIGRAALGSSIIDEEMTDTTELGFPERLQNFYFCFSVVRAIDSENTNVPQEYFINLYKVTVFIYDQGGIDLASVPSNTEQSNSVIYTLWEDDQPTSKANKFVDKYDFLVAITKK